VSDIKFISLGQDGLLFCGHHGIMVVTDLRLRQVQCLQTPASLGSFKVALGLQEVVISLSGFTSEKAISDVLRKGMISSL